MIRWRINSLLQLYYFFLGVLIISYVLYVRVILNRVPKELYLFEPISYKLIFMVISGITLSIFIIIKSISLLLYPNKISNNIFNTILSQISNIISDSLREVYNIIISNINNSYELISSLAYHFYEKFGKLHEGFFLFVSYIIRFFIVMAFLIDVFYFFELKYFYKALILLTISLSIKIVFFILKDFATNLEEIASYLTLVNDAQDSSNIKFIPSHGNEDINLEYHINHFRICSQINGYLDVYNFLLNYYNPRVNLFIYLLYLIGWLYILFHNLFWI